MECGNFKKRKTFFSRASICTFCALWFSSPRSPPHLTPAAQRKHVSVLISVLVVNVQPCFNGGSCFNRGGTFLCACVAPFTGKQHHTARSHAHTEGFVKETREAVLNATAVRSPEWCMLPLITITTIANWPAGLLLLCLYKYRYHSAGAGGQSRGRGDKVGTSCPGCLYRTTTRCLP